ncbi:unnamed protein product [Prorocentrum cordatum]|uniref:Uncharacterized protein n=1 Tax=Prorocentrum cordatum TaxID=2364126 RepID=A0ABN9WNT5_9DINO|nr:unnamed protein product [Polarella glacialis]
MRAAAGGAAPGLVAAPEENGVCLAVMPSGRAGLMCANPSCWYLVHPDPSFGGYCCKKCHWHGKAKRSGRAKKHGAQCIKQDAPEGAPRAPPVTPDKPLKDADPGDFESGGGPGADVEFSSPARTGHGPTGFGDVAVDSAPMGPVGCEVRVCGLVKHRFFNGLTARVEQETADGRFDLLLADGTRLRWIKEENFQGPAGSQGPEPLAVPVSGGTDAGEAAPLPPQPPLGLPPGPA